MSDFQITTDSYEAREERAWDTTQSKSPLVNYLARINLVRNPARTEKILHIVTCAVFVYSLYFLWQSFNAPVTPPISSTTPTFNPINFKSLPTSNVNPPIAPLQIQ